MDNYYLHIADLNDQSIYPLIAQPVEDLRQVDDGGLTFSTPQIIG